MDNTTWAIHYIRVNNTWGRGSSLSDVKSLDTDFFCQGDSQEEPDGISLLSTDFAPIAFGEPAKKRRGYQGTEI